MMYIYQCGCGTEYVSVRTEVPCYRCEIPTVFCREFITEYEALFEVHVTPPLLVVTSAEYDLWELHRQCFWIGCPGNMYIADGRYGHGSCSNCRARFHLLEQVDVVPC